MSGEQPDKLQRALRKRPRVRPDRAGEPGVRPERMLQWFVFDHLPDGQMKDTSAQFACLAESVVASIPACPERTVALRKLLEAKDCAVRAVLEARAMQAEAERKEREAAEHIREMEEKSSDGRCL